MFYVEHLIIFPLWETIKCTFTYTFLDQLFTHVYGNQTAQETFPPTSKVWKQ